MPFSPDTFNDLQLFEDASEKRILDVSHVMIDKHLKILNHHSSLPFNDIISNDTDDESRIIDLQPENIIRIRKTRTYSSEDIRLPERGGFPLLSSIQKYRSYKSRTISIIEPLGDIPHEPLDIRDLEYIARKKHPDIFLGELPLHKNIYRYSIKHKKTLFHIGKRTAKISIVFAIIIVSLVIFAIGLKNYIQSSTTEQYQKILALKSVRDPDLIIQESEKIRSQFARLGLIFAPIDIVFDNPIYSNSSVKLAHDVIYGGKEVAEMTKILGSFLKVGKEFATTEGGNIQSSQNAGIFGNYSNLKITDLLRNNEDKLFSFQEHINNAVHYYGQIKSLGNSSLDAKFNQVFEALYMSQKYTNFILANFDNILYALGDKKPQRYVILNQNRDEIRASGGFPGSVITLELYKGTIQKYDKNDVYYYDWHLYPYKEVPPEGLNKISTNYGLRDANYYPEFSKSLDKINFFYEKAGEGSIDTLIAINQGIIIDFLKKYGSIKLKEINTDVTADNFSTLMSILVENKLGAKISPKDILFRFSEEFEKMLLDKKDIIGYIDLILKEIDNGEVLFASRDTAIQKFIESSIRQETWKTNPGNWFYPIFTSIGGNKSDRYVERNFETESIAFSGCLVQNTVHLTSTHPFGVKQEIDINQIFTSVGITDPKERERLMQIEGESENRQFIRYIIPKKASLNSQSSEKNLVLDTTNPDYSVISFYLDTPVRQTVESTISYTVPVPNCTSNLQFFKQPGLTNYQFRQK